MKMTVSVDLCVEDVEALVQALDTTEDETLKNFIEQVLFKVHKHSEMLKENSEAFEKVNPYSLVEAMRVIS